MNKNLLIVESPAKAKTIKKYLGADFEVLSSYGHVYDIVPKSGSVDVENNFATKYETIEKNLKHVSAIAKALKSVDCLYLGTDPDREGEAIAFNISCIMQDKGLLAKDDQNQTSADDDNGKNKKAKNNKSSKIRTKKFPEVHRVVFHEITKDAIINAVNKPREISIDLVHAQQARRILDYLVGFNLSPLLWKKISYGLSAGRVQSPALRMIVEIENEIEKFVSEEYWTITALLSKKDIDGVIKKFTAKLINFDGEKLSQFSIKEATQNKNVIEKLKEDIANTGNQLKVLSVEKKQKKRHPAPPFITSTLQQEAIRKLGFTSSKTMRVAQQLYENGIISYMRTDSVNLSSESVRSIRKFIAEKFGSDNVPKSPLMYKTKVKNAQEAHEAIRPTDIFKEPSKFLTNRILDHDQSRLYDLVWKRTVACQMESALVDTVTVDLGCKLHVFRTNGSHIVKLGFLSVYEESKEGEKDNEDSDDSNKNQIPVDVESNTKKRKDEVLLPFLVKGDLTDLIDLNGDQHFTLPPPRYTEASLIKSLEEHGIGRPSTYASIIHTLISRKYVWLENKKFRPTHVGTIVNGFLTNYFFKYVDYDFTAKMEDRLDEIAKGNLEYIAVLREFWESFISFIKEADTTVKRQDVRRKILDRECPKCGKKLAICLGKNASCFIGCTGFPDCTYVENFDERAPDQANVTPDTEMGERENIKNDDANINKDRPAEVVDLGDCPMCNEKLVERKSRYGKFVGCSGYPKCRYMKSLQGDRKSDSNDRSESQGTANSTGIQCPECKKGYLRKVKSKYGTYFYPCSCYPKCKYLVKYEPLSEACKKCGWPVLMCKSTKKAGVQKICPQKDCGYMNGDNFNDD